MAAQAAEAQALRALELRALEQRVAALPAHWARGRVPGLAEALPAHRARRVDSRPVSRPASMPQP